jgi:hypothetical protein
MHRHPTKEQKHLTVKIFQSQFNCYFDFHSDPLFVSLNRCHFTNENNFI